MATQTIDSHSTAAALAKDERWQLVLRITSSQQFAKATQLREILLYITRSWLLDETVSIHEQDIACSVLGRRDDFNPAEDNIVRVQIRHLRKKLEQYFATEGMPEPVELNIPKGSYVPRFEKRSERPETSAAPAMTTIEPVLVSAHLPNMPGPQHQEFGTTQRMKRIWLAVGISLFALVSFSVGRLTRIPDPARAAVRKTGQNFLLNRVFVSDLPISVVVADTNLVVLQNMLHTDISVNDYISKEYPENILRYATDPQVHNVLKQIALRRFTSLADVNVATRCAELSKEFGSRTAIRYARNMNARDFERGNFILIGSRTADPWVGLFEPQLNFAYEKDPATQVFRFRNKNPMPGEQNLYVAQPEKDGSTTSYVDIAMVPNLSRTGYVLLLNAATMDANEAATELLFRNEFPAALSKLVTQEIVGSAGTQSFEIFLRDHAIDGVVSGFDVVAVRKLG